MLEIINKHSPKEVYVISMLFFFFMFLNLGELLTASVNLSQVFSPRGSVIYGFIRGIADNHLSRYSAYIFYWVIVFTYISLVILKARKISRWLWDN